MGMVPVWKGEEGLRRGEKTRDSLSRTPGSSRALWLLLHHRLQINFNGAFEDIEGG